jgi:23S rRNA (cytosine1962-C5)-methyltransferase
VAARRASVAGGTTGLRLVHGEADGLPGLVADVYGNVVVIQQDTDAVDGLLRTLAEACIAEWPVATHAIRQHRAASGGDPTPAAHRIETLAGGRPHLPIEFTENEVIFEADPAMGHKTGFYLDQRPNRELVQRLSAGLRVLNLFSYTGGFSVAAALGGAREVTSVDTGGPVLQAARRNFRRNGLDPDGGAYRFVQADVFDLLGTLTQAYDLVVCDPPSMARSEAARGKALQAYRRLNRDAIRCVAPQGLLLTASCSSHVREADLVAAVAAGAADAGRHIRILAFLGAGTDHPVLPAFPEGRTLNALLVFIA